MITEIEGHPIIMKDFSISRKHSMDHVTVDGVIPRIGDSNKRDWYLVLQNKK